MKKRSTRLNRLICFIALASLMSCKQEPKWQTTITEAAGIISISSPSIPKFIDNVLSLEEDLSIGVDEGDENYMFSFPVDIDSDSNGNIYVLDFKELTIKKYDRRGTFERNISRQGQGPGELEYPNCFYVDLHDLVHILDYSEKKIEIFDVNGNYKKSIKLAVNAEAIAANPENGIIVNHDETVYEDEKSMRRISSIGILREGTNVITDFFSIKKPGFKAIQRGDEYRVEVPIEKNAIDPKGNIYIGTTNKYEISVYTPQGRLLTGFSRIFQPIPRESEIMDKVMDQLSKSTPANQIEEYRELLKNHRIIENISVDEKNRLWITLHQPPVNAAAPNGTIIDIFSKEGEYIAQLKMNRKIERQIIFKNGYAYALTQNELGFSRANRFKVVESSDSRSN